MTPPWIPPAEAVQITGRGAGLVAGEALPSFRSDPVPGADFGRMVERGVGEVNRQLLVSQSDLQNLATGNAQNLHQIMIRLEESRLSLLLLMQVRNRLLEAYQDVMKMQV